MGWQDSFSGLWIVYKLQGQSLMLDDSAANQLRNALTKYLTLTYSSASVFAGI